MSNFFQNQTIATVLIIIVTGSFFIISASLFTIYTKTYSLCQQTKQEYTGDCVKRLIQQSQDESQTYKDRNDAIWALGQFADKRAEKPLSELYNGSVPSTKEPYDTMLSQYELYKALKWIKRGNITSWLHRIINM
ncbi:hypothetical protein KC726_05500 [Candidatus Woesebacteria bacterium]|nr:hypothetical protein [Candidatus Woesebacteria bacterium]